MFTHLVQTVNNMYQNVGDKSIENQELILRVFFAVACDPHTYHYPIHASYLGTITVYSFETANRDPALIIKIFPIRKLRN